MTKRKSTKPQRALIAAKARAEAERKWKAALRDLENRYRSQIDDYRLIVSRLRRQYDDLSDHARRLSDRLGHPWREIARGVRAALPFSRSRGGV